MVRFSRALPLMPLSVVQPTMASHRDRVGKQHQNTQKKIGSTLKKSFITDCRMGL